MVIMAGNPSPLEIGAPKGWPAEIRAIETSLGDVPFLSVFKDVGSRDIVAQFVSSLVAQDRGSQGVPQNAGDRNFRIHAIRLGLASLGAFLQTNVTGPVLQGTEISDAAFTSAYEDVTSPPAPGVNGVSSQTSSIDSFRRICLRSLDTDGVSVYPYIPQIELFGLARFIFTAGTILPVEAPEAWEAGSDDTLTSDLAWTRLRIHLWHYKLLTQPSLGSGSLYTKSGRWTDVATLQAVIEKSLEEAESSITSLTGSDEAASGNLSWSRQTQTQFYLEKANANLMLGNDKLAQEALRVATDKSGFVYALSGALGKRTRFQEKDISQLVVLARSMQLSDGDADDQKSSEDAPSTLPLNDDTLLENIEFKDEETTESDSTLPAQLRGISPDKQPKLRAEDHIILLTEATLRDTFSPSDALTSEEILPFAVRVINDKSTNWQIYTQALLVRSRIEFHRSRTLERAVLQMQAVVDQVIVDTQAAPPATNGTAETKSSGDELDIPSIEVTETNGDGSVSTTPHKPTSFLPVPKPNESASAQERLRYVNTLASPPR